MSDELDRLAVPRHWLTACVGVALVDLAAAAALLAYAVTEGRTMACLGGAAASVCLLAAVPSVRFATRVPLGRRHVAADALLAIGIGLAPPGLWLALALRVWL